MSRFMKIQRLALPAVLAVALLGTACNSIGDNPDWSEAVIHGTALEYTNASAADNKPVSAKITFAVIDRNQGGSSSSDLNSIEFTSIVLTFTSPVLGSTTASGEGIFYPVGSSGNIIVLDITPPGVGEVAGNVISAHARFDGRDNLGRHAQYDVDLGTTILP